MNILFVSLMQGSPWGGSEELWVKVASEFLANNHKVFFCVKKWVDINDKLRKLEERGGIGLYREPPGSKKKSLVERVARKLLRKRRKNGTEWDIIENIEVDYVFVNFGGNYDILCHEGLVTFIKKKDLKYSVLLQFNTENSPLPDLERFMVKSFFLNADILFFVSKRNLEVYSRNLVEKFNNAIIVNNPVNSEYLHLLPFPEISLGLNMACVARLETSIKGQDLLIEALSADVWKKRNWSLNFYGTGVDYNYINDLISFYQLNDKIKLLGYEKNIEKIWIDNHILVLVSNSEGTPLSLIEAMYCGRGALVTDVGGNSTLISENYTGFLVSSQNITLIREKLEIMWEQKKMLEKYGLNANEKVRLVNKLNDHMVIYNSIYKSR